MTGLATRDAGAGRKTSATSSDRAALLLGRELQAENGVLAEQIRCLRDLSLEGAAGVHGLSRAICEAKSCSRAHFALPAYARAASAVVADTQAVASARQLLQSRYPAHRETSIGTYPGQAGAFVQPSTPRAEQSRPPTAGALVQPSTPSADLGSLRVDGDSASVACGQPRAHDDIGQGPTLATGLLQRLEAERLQDQVAELEHLNSELGRSITETLGNCEDVRAEIVALDRGNSYLAQVMANGCPDNADFHLEFCSDAGTLALMHEVLNMREFVQRRRTEVWQAKRAVTLARAQKKLSAALRSVTNEGVLGAVILRWRHCVHWRLHRCEEDDAPSVVFTMRVENVSYKELSANVALVASFKATVREVIASQAGTGLLPDHVHVALSAGSVVVHAKVTPPIAASARLTLASMKRLVSSDSFCQEIAEKIGTMGGIQAVTRGIVNVTHTGPPAIARGGDRGDCGASLAPVVAFAGPGEMVAAECHGRSPHYEGSRAEKHARCVADEASGEDAVAADVVAAVRAEVDGGTRRTKGRSIRLPASFRGVSHLEDPLRTGPSAAQLRLQQRLARQSRASIPATRAARSLGGHSIVAGAKGACHGRGNEDTEPELDMTLSKRSRAKKRNNVHQSGFGWMLEAQATLLDAFSASGHSRAQPVYSVGEDVLSYSTSKDRWLRGKVVGVKEGAVVLCYSAPQGHEVKREYCPHGGRVQPRYQVGDRVQCFSETVDRWIGGVVKRVLREVAIVAYDSGNGSKSYKRLAFGSEDLRGDMDSCTIGSQVEVFSRSQSRWLPGRVTQFSHVVITVSYSTPDGQTVTKEVSLDEHWSHKRVMPNFCVGDEVRCWSTIHRAWVNATVDAVLHRTVVVEYTVMDGDVITKEFPADSENLRRAVDDDDESGMETSDSEIFIVYGETDNEEELRKRSEAVEQHMRFEERRKQRTATKPASAFAAKKALAARLQKKQRRAAKDSKKTRPTE